MAVRDHRLPVGAMSDSKSASRRAVVCDHDIDRHFVGTGVMDAGAERASRGAACLRAHLVEIRFRVVEKAKEFVDRSSCGRLKYPRDHEQGEGDAGSKTPGG